ncbi:MAG TPA: RAMP superfamily CRISPR-associated protein [Thermoanaerobaculia bacterium]|jgi:CRISPR/Cas system CSM-associated protein Csm3 (group 7 of RAMP superfamily)
MSDRISRTLAIHVHTYWHAGTGRGEGPGSDARVARTPNGLPFLPGRTVKGLVRAAVEQALALEWLERDIDRQAIVRWFGKPLPRLSEGDAEERVREMERAEYRFQEGEGQLRFTSARIGQGDFVRRWEEWAEVSADKDLLFRSLASTRVDRHGVATDQSLREVEVALPMVLNALIEGPADERWPRALAAALPLIRALGSGRNRGLGRASFKLESE